MSVAAWFWFAAAWFWAAGDADAWAGAAEDETGVGAVEEEGAEDALGKIYECRFRLEQELKLTRRGRRRPACWSSRTSRYRRPRWCST